MPAQLAEETSFEAVVKTVEQLLKLSDSLLPDHRGAHRSNRSLAEASTPGFARPTRCPLTGE